MKGRSIEVNGTVVTITTCNGHDPGTEWHPEDGIPTHAGSELSRDTLVLEELAKYWTAPARGQRK